MTTCPADKPAPRAPATPLGTDGRVHGWMLLCERCGYPLPGIHERHGCPECGAPSTESDPARRAAPLWQRKPSIGSWIDVLVDVAFRPSHFFRTLRIDGPNLLPRLYLLTVASLIGAGWALGELLWLRRDPALAWVLGAATAAAVVALSYTEAVGVAFFSRRRGWRVPFKLSERVVCYASPGWVVAAGGLLYLAELHHSGDLVRYLGWVAGPAVGRQIVPAVFALAGGLTVMGFEALVYVGVRQVKYANAPTPGSIPAPGITADPWNRPKPGALRRNAPGSRREA